MAVPFFFSCAFESALLERRVRQCFHGSLPHRRCQIPLSIEARNDSVSVLKNIVTLHSGIAPRENRLLKFSRIIQSKLAVERNAKRQEVTQNQAWLRRSFRTFWRQVERFEPLGVWNMALAGGRGSHRSAGSPGGSWAGDFLSG